MTAGADVRWRSPVKGLLLGASYLRTNLKASSATSGGIPAPGQFKYTTDDFYAEYQTRKLKLEAELNHEPSYERYGDVPYVYNPHFYVKVEGHFVKGTAKGLYDANNPEGLRSASQLLVTRLGFVF